MIPTAFRRYAIVTALAAAIAMVPVASAGSDFGEQPLAFVLLAACVVAAELLPVRIPRGDGLFDDLTLSGAFALALTLLGGPAIGVAVYAGACLIGDLVERPARIKTVFNVSQCVVVMAGASAVFAAIAGHQTVMSLSTDGLAVIAATAFFFLADNVLTGVAVALLSGGSPRDLLRAQVSVHSWTEASVLALTPVVVAATREATWLIPLLVVPIGGILVGGRQAAANWYRVLYDDVTGLPNRELVLRRMGEMLAQEGRRGRRLGVAVVSVSGLKSVADALGAAAAERAAALIGKRLAAVETDGRTLARTGPYAFAITGLAEDRARFAHEVTETVATVFATPCMVGDLALTIYAHTGIAWEPATPTTPWQLLARAAAAADEAASLEEAVHEAPVEEREPLDRLILAGQLQRGIAGGELRLEYQPKQALGEGLRDAVEALARWDHPELGLLSPQAFVPLAESTGLIGGLTRWVASTAMRQCAEWRRAGFEVRVAVNVSARDLVDPGFAEHIEEQMRTLALPAGALQLEVTESQLLGKASDAGRAVERLARAGVSCAIDDFGTGYSSLSQLQRLRVDEIKIDRSFVDELEHGSANAAIVESTIGLARTLGLRVTAEGVETRTALERLIELGCDYAQGYYVGRPMAAESCRASVAARAGTAGGGTRRFQPEVAAAGSGRRAR